MSTSLARRGGYTRYTAAMITDFLRQGWSNEEIASALQVTPATLNKWLHSREDVKRAVELAQRPLEAEAESAMFELAAGATEERVVETFAVAEGGQLIPTAREVVTHKHAPDYKALVFWLKNRRPERWNDRQEHDVRTLSVNLNLDAKDAEL